MLTQPCQISQHPLLPAEFSSEVNKWGLVTTVHTVVHLFMLMWANLISSTSLGMKAVQSDLLAPTVRTVCMNFELLGATAEDSECQHWAVELSLGHTHRNTQVLIKRNVRWCCFSPQTCSMCDLSSSRCSLSWQQPDSMGLPGMSSLQMRRDYCIWSCAQASQNANQVIKLE